LPNLSSGHRELVESSSCHERRAKDLGASLGNELNIRAASGTTEVLRISALFDLGNKGAYERNAYLALRTAQSLLARIGAVTTIELTIHHIYAAETLAQQIAAANPVRADSWISTNAQFFTAVNAQKTSHTLIRVFVALSVAFGIPPRNGRPEHCGNESARRQLCRTATSTLMTR
jgi:lipoprotein-releasing system permease protein